MGPSLVFRTEICAVCTLFVPVARGRSLGVPSSMVVSTMWCFLVGFLRVPFFCCPTILPTSSHVDNGLATEGSDLSGLVCHDDSSCIDGLMDGCKGFRGLFGCKARSNLHEECFVKKLSPHFHWFEEAYRILLHGVSSDTSCPPPGCFWITLLLLEYHETPCNKVQHYNSTGSRRPAPNFISINCFTASFVTRSMLPCYCKSSLTACKAGCTIIVRGRHYN